MSKRESELNEIKICAEWRQHQGSNCSEGAASSLWLENPSEAQNLQAQALRKGSGQVQGQK